MSRLLCAWLAAASLGGAAEVRLNVPFVKQERQGCGAASIAMVMQYWNRSGPEADPGRIHRELVSPKAGGVYANDMQRYFRAWEFRTFVFRGSRDDLEQHLAKGRPLIVCLKKGALHYVVVAGIDPEEDVVIVNDPAVRKLLKMDLADFETAWAAMNHWTLLAVPAP